MRAAVVLLACLAFVSANVIPKPMNRIVGGELTTIESYPFAAAMLITYDLATYWQNCGGTIVNTRSIVSAAHCYDGRTAIQYRIRVGSTYANSGGVVHNTQTIIMHPDYNMFTIDSDIAILHTATPIVYSNVVAPASIAGTTYYLAHNTPVWAIGWGHTEYQGTGSEQLRHVQIWTVDQSICSSRYANLGAGWSITDNMLCVGYLDVGGRDQCQNDSGGPLLHNNVLVGVCSYGEGCGDPFYPGVNTRVSRFTDWIVANA